MWILEIVLSLTMNDVTVVQGFRHREPFSTEQACYSKAIADAPEFLEQVKENYGPEVAKTMLLEPKCSQTGSPA